MSENHQRLKVIIHPTDGLRLMTAEGKKITHGAVHVSDDPKLNGYARMTVEFEVFPDGEVFWGHQ